jgi:hypothetical protein
MYYEIYDSETRNLLMDTETVAEALAIVRATVGKHGPEAVAHWILVEGGDAHAEGGRPIATGDALARLAAKPRTTLARSHD